MKTKLEQLQQANAEANKDSGRLNDELLVMRRRCDDLCHELAKKTREVDLLQNRVHDLESLLNKAHDDYQAQLAAERDEIKRLKAELEQRFAEFTDLMNTKIALDQEILMYRKMLEGEESRWVSSCFLSYFISELINRHIGSRLCVQYLFYLMDKQEAAEIILLIIELFTAFVFI